MAPFDPYHIWLGIPPEDQPPSHYRLLAIPELESNPDVIDTAAERQTLMLRTFQAGDQAQLAEQLLNEVSAARICLLDAEQKAEYDNQRRGTLESAPEADPQGFAALQTTPVVPSPSRPTQPIWQQPRLLSAAGGVVVVVLLLLVLNSGRDKPSPLRNPEEREAELKRLVDERVREALLKAEEAAARVEMEKAAAEKRAGEQAAARAAMEKVAAEEAAAKREADKLAPALAAEEAAAKAAMAKAAAEPLTLKGHSDWVNSVAFSPDGKRIVSGSADETVKVWDAETGQLALTLKGHSISVMSVSFSPDGRRIVSGSADETLKVWDAETGQEMLTLDGHSDWVHSVSFSPDGKRIVSGSGDETVKVWDAETGQETLTYRGHSNNAAGVKLAFTDVVNSITSVSFSPDGKRIVSGGIAINYKGGIGGIVKVWDSETGQGLFDSEEGTLKGRLFRIRSVSFSPDGKRIVSGSDYRRVKVLDAETGEIMLTLEGHSGRVESVSFSPDGRRIVSGSWDKTVKVWDAKTGQELLTLEGHSSSVNSVSFSPDGSRIVSGSFDNTVKVWNVPLLEAAKAAMEKAAAERTTAVKKQMTPAQLALGDPVVNSVGMLLVPIPVGEFQMGSPDFDSLAKIDEKPQHLVNITKPFYLGVYEVTRQQYEKAMGSRPWQGKVGGPWHGKQYVKEGADYPAVYVSHDDAVEFCRRLSKQEGVEYRLPTEAEWEYACRAGTTTDYSFGDGEAKLGQYAWYDKNAWDIGEKYPHRGGQKLLNRWGLYDMHGNVWEWCQDWYGPYGSEKVVSDPMGPAQGVNRRVLRGGSFNFPSSSVRSANRFNTLPDNRFNFNGLGFRAARTYSVSP